MKITTKIVFLVVLWVIIQNYKVQSQTSATPPTAATISKYLPPTLKESPDVATFRKFVDVPVGHYTGTPNISVPLYNLESQTLSVPISINYHASGVRVEDEASQVGIGWTLNAGGMISRSIRGRDDFDGILRQGNITQDSVNAALKPPYDITDQGVNKNTLNIFTKTGDDKQNYDAQVQLALFCNELPSQSLMTTARRMTDPDVLDNGRPLYDGQSDIFSFQAGSYSGKFVITRHQEPYKIYIISQDPIKVEILANTVSGIGTPDLTGNSGFKITTPDGTQYFYRQIEQARSTTGEARTGKIRYPDYPATDPDNGGLVGLQWYKPISSVKIYISAWYLTQIIAGTNDNEAITMSYTTATTFSEPLPSRIQNLTAIQTQPTWRLTYNQQKNVFLNSISSSKGNVVFKRSGRTDIRGGGALKLDSVVVQDMYGQQVMAYKFYNSYTNSGSGQPAHISQRLRLDSLVELGRSNVAKPAYKFKYFDTVTSLTNTQQPANLPDKNAYSQDFWGYYNGETQNDLLTNTATGINTGGTGIAPCPRCDGTMVPAVVPVTAMIWGFQNPAIRTPKFEYTRLGTMQSMTYPTGGFLKLEFEPHSFSNYTKDPAISSISVTNYITPGTTLIKGAGLRIGATKLIFDSADTTKYLLKKYDYSTNAFGMVLSTGKLMYDMSFSYLLNYSDAGGAPYQILSSGTRYPMSQSANGNPIGYSKVRELQTNTANNANNGFTDFFFENNVDVRYDSFCFDINTDLATGQACAPLSPLPITQNCEAYELVFNERGIRYNKIIIQEQSIPNIASNRNGLLLNKQIYTDAGTLLEDETNQYTTPSKTAKTRVKAFISKGRSPFDLYPALFVYYIDTEWIKLENKTVVSYPSGQTQSVTNYTRFVYGDNTHKQITKTVTLNSVNDSITTTMRYPVNFATGTNIYQQMVGRNLLIPIIENIQNNQTKGTEISLVRNNYKNFSNNIAYTQINIERSKRTMWGGTDTDEVIFNYDQNANLTEISPRNGTPTTIIWGYNNNYPVAKISGISLSNTNNVINSVGLTQSSFNTLAGATDNARDTDLKAKLNSLRTQLSTSYKDAQMVGLTYLTTVGLSSQTDPTGRATTYQYDAFNRLSKVFDHQNRLLKAFCYNYLGQNIDCFTGSYVGTTQAVAGKSLLDDQTCISIINRSAPVLAGQTQTDTACQQINILSGFSIAPGGTYNGVIQQN